MSLDIEVWSEKPFNVSEWLPESDKWEQFGDEWSYEGDGWQVLVNLDETEPISESVKEKIGSAKFVAYTTLEPIGADTEGYAFLEKVVREMTRNAQGVWVDPYDQVLRADEGSFE